MNNCILMAEITKGPELRYTQDNQTAIAELEVQFPGSRPEDPFTKLKAIGWGNLAQEIQEQYHTGETVVLEGRLAMNTIDRPEGFKEKRAELTIQRIHSLGSGVSLNTHSTSAAPANRTAPAPTMSSPPPAAPARSAPVTAPPATESNFDEIPF